MKDFDSSSNDVHIDKTTNYPIKGKIQKLKIRVPINSEIDVSIQNQNSDQDIPTRLKKEVKNAFENKKKEMRL